MFGRMVHASHKKSLRMEARSASHLLNNKCLLDIGRFSQSDHIHTFCRYPNSGGLIGYRRILLHTPAIHVEYFVCIRLQQSGYPHLYRTTRRYRPYLQLYSIRCGASNSSDQRISEPTIAILLPQAIISISFMRIEIGKLIGLFRLAVAIRSSAAHPTHTRKRSFIVVLSFDVTSFVVHFLHRFPLQRNLCSIRSASRKNQSGYGQRCTCEQPLLKALVQRKQGCR